MDDKKISDLENEIKKLKEENQSLESELETCVAAFEISENRFNKLATEMKTLLKSGITKIQQLDR